MDKKDLILLIEIIILIIFCCIFFAIKIDTNLINEESKIELQCEHEWVVSSKYNFIFKSYKTISKCVKCGIEM